MRLDYEGIKDTEWWIEKGCKLPLFDIDEVREATYNSPEWIHFGAGNIFRAFQANRVQDMLNKGLTNKGLIVVEGFDYEIIEKINKPHDNLSILVTLKGDGNIEKNVVASITEGYVLDQANEDYERLKEIFANPSLKMASFTITEKGYQLRGNDGEYLPNVKKDFENGPNDATSYIGKVAALLYHRSLVDGAKLSMVSMDNCSHNGEKLYGAIHEFAIKWFENGHVGEDFIKKVEDEKVFAFPFTMIDKITPRPDESILNMLKADGVEDIDPVITSKNTYIAPFVNSEECEYLVIEDLFPGGREKLEDAGFIFTDQETVEKVERMKVCTCLNPLHTALAVYGCLLGYTKISDEMKDEELVTLVNRIGYVEGLPVVEDPGVLNPQEFIDAVVNMRIPNPYMPDTPQRIATDTSQKLSIRFGETVKKYIASDEYEISDLKMIPLVFAGWIRYLMGVNDDGEDFTLSPDPMLESVRPLVKDIKLGDKITENDLKDILSNEKIFGVDLIKVGLSDLVVRYFNELNEGIGAIRNTLKREVTNEEE
ncbi:MAG: mannitol dehydrogenase family protein [Lachnospiraceae bacterium]|nr:mannitol dehydrogenase family protein [Lachnospiraceae bacterium]